MSTHSLSELTLSLVGWRDRKGLMRKIRRGSDEGQDPKSNDESEK
jgi:hypothetical protein